MKAKYFRKIKENTEFFIIRNMYMHEFSLQTERILAYNHENALERFAKRKGIKLKYGVKETNLGLSNYCVCKEKNKSNTKRYYL